MSVVVWWGTRAEAARRGVVADVCPSCSCVTSFLVFDHFTAFHVYEVAVGEPQYVESTRYCLNCQKQLPFDDELYLDVLSPSEVGSISMEEGIRRTNRKLAALLELLDHLRHLSAGAAYRSRDIEASREALDEAVRLFEKLIYRGADLTGIARALTRWELLSDTEHAAVLSSLRVLAGPHEIQPA